VIVKKVSSLVLFLELVWIQKKIRCIQNRIDKDNLDTRVKAKLENMSEEEKLKILEK